MILLSSHGAVMLVAAGFCAAMVFTCAALEARRAAVVCAVLVISFLAGAALDARRDRSVAGGLYSRGTGDIIWKKEVLNE